MSEQTEIINPNQDFKSPVEAPPHVTGDENPNQSFKSTEGLREPYSMQFGDVIKFGHERGENVTKSVIVDVGADITFYVWDIQTINGVECINLMPAISGQNIDQEFDFFGRRLTLEEIEKLMENYQPKSDIEKKIRDRLLTKNKSRLRELAAKEPRTRIVTMAQIQAASRIKDSERFREAVYSFGKQQKQNNENK